MNALEEQAARVAETIAAAQRSEELARKAAEDLQRHGKAMVGMGVGL